jgi:NAD(P)-dependent dehydrogenase (short-subunit alcohol dehydrogenase family)
VLPRRTKPLAPASTKVTFAKEGEMKTALITGAYRGLGYEVARQLSERGWKVILTARKTDVGSAAAAKLKNTSFLELDITDSPSVARAAEKVPELDVLINNAAMILEGDQDILTIAPELVSRTIETNALGALRVSQAFLPHLLKSSAGRIINVSSGAGQLSEMGTWSPAYAVSKTSLNAITCLLAASLKDKGTAVNSVCPGWCRTEMGGAGAPRSVGEGADGIVWLAADAPQQKSGLFWRDREIISW